MNIVNAIIPIPQKNKPKTNTEKPPTQKFWDPCGKTEQPTSIDQKNKKLQKKLEYYKENPHAPLRNLILFSLPGICCIIFLITFPELAKEITTDSDGDDGRLIYFFPFAIPLFYRMKVRGLQRDLVKYLIAQEKKWIYNPEESRSHWSNFENKFPEFFRVGDLGQNMQDEFWGKYSKGKQDIDFYSGIFQYKTEHRDSKGRRHTSTHNRNIFAIKLNKKLKSDFQLTPESIISKFFNFFKRKEVNTESSEFNKIFSFSYNGKKDEKAIEIIKTLSPAVQTKLIELNEKEKGISILLRDETIIFMMNGILLKKMKTNFFRKVQLDPRDKKYIETRINNILEISNDLIRYLD